MIALMPDEGAGMKLHQAAQGLQAGARHGFQPQPAFSDLQVAHRTPFVAHGLDPGESLVPRRLWFTFLQLFQRAQFRQYRSFVADFVVRLTEGDLLAFVVYDPDVVQAAFKEFIDLAVYAMAVGEHELRRALPGRAAFPLHDIPQRIQQVARHQHDVPAKIQRPS